MPSLAGTMIGFVGLGLMGKPMARHLAQAGARMTVYNRSRGPMEELAAEGMTPAKSPCAAAEAVDTVVVMVTDTVAAEAVIMGPNGVIEGVRDGTLIIDMGTTQVSNTRRMAEAVRTKGGDYVDAPVSGGQVGAVEATLTIMAGGSEAAFARARPIFETLGKHITHLGEVGAGQVAKSANQVIVGMTIGAVAEALSMAKHAGVDPAKLREALTGGFADSRILQLHGKRMVDGTFEPGGRVSVQLKDVRQALALAAEIGLRMPGLERNRDLWERMVEKGWGDLDHSALIKIIDEP